MFLLWSTEKQYMWISRALNVEGLNAISHNPRSYLWLVSQTNSLKHVMCLLNVILERNVCISWSSAVMFAYQCHRNVMNSHGNVMLINKTWVYKGDWGSVLLLMHDCLCCSFTIHSDFCYLGMACFLHANAPSFLRCLLHLTRSIWFSFWLLSQLIDLCSCKKQSFHSGFWWYHWFRAKFRASELCLWAFHFFVIQMTHGAMSLRLEKCKRS